MNTLVAPDAERAVLGACMLDQSVVPLVMSEAKEGWFSDPRHAAIYKVMEGLFCESKKFDLVLLVEIARGALVLDECGGTPYLSSVLGSVATSGGVGSHLEVLRDRFVRRELNAVAGRIVCDTSGELSARECLDEASSRLLAVAECREGGFTSVGEAMGSTFAELERLSGSPADVTGIPCGLAELDILTSGWQKSDYVILAARPGMGKTSMALGWALHAAAKDVCVGVFSMEMSRRQVVERLLAQEAGVSYGRMRTGHLTPPDWSRLATASGWLSDAPIHVNDVGALTLMEIAANARMLKMRHGLGLVIVDYVQLMRGGYRENRQQEISEISRGFKALAKSLNVPIVVLSQLSRAVETRGGDKRPVLADLRDSGSLEQDADAVLFLYRPGQYEVTPDDVGYTEILIRKQRNGPTGKVKAKFIGREMRFEEWPVIGGMG